MRVMLISSLRLTRSTTSEYFSLAPVRFRIADILATEQSDPMRP